jgi:hypothetical protein
MNSNRNHLSSMDAKVAWAADRNAFDDPVGQSLQSCWNVSIKDPVISELMDSRIRYLLQEDAEGELPPFRAWRQRGGDVVLGKDYYGSLVRWPASWFRHGTELVGNTGSAKTTLLCCIVVQLAVLRCCVWLFEGHKRFLRRLRRALLAAGISCVILRPRRWKLNPLQCDTGDLRGHAERLRDILSRHLDAGVRGGIYLGQAFHTLYARFGNWEGRTDAWPTLLDLCEFIRTSPGLVTIARDALLDRLVALCVSCTPQAIAWRIGWRVPDLVRFNIVFECHGVSIPASQVIHESLLYSAFQNEVEHGVSNGPLRLFIAFEDSQRLFDTGSRADSGLTPLEELVSVGRGMGLGFCPLAQSTLGYSRKLRVNLANKIMGRMGAAEDYHTLGADMGQTPEQLHWNSLHLKPGWFVAQAGSGDYREPFLFQCPRLPELPFVDDTEADASAAALDALPAVFADDYAAWTPFPIVEVQSTAENPSATTTTPVTPEATLAPADRSFLETVVENPGQPAGFYARRNGLSGKRAAAIRKRLLAAGLVRVRTLAAKGKGRPAIVLEPLPAAFVATGKPQPEVKS